MRQQQNEILANKLRAARFKRKAAIRKLNPNAVFPLDAEGVEAQAVTQSALVKHLNDDQLIEYAQTVGGELVSELVQRLTKALEANDKQQENFDVLKTQLSNRVNKLNDLMAEFDEHIEDFAAA